MCVCGWISFKLSIYFQNSIADFISLEGIFDLNHNMFFTTFFWATLELKDGDKRDKVHWTLQASHGTSSGSTQNTSCTSTAPTSKRLGFISGHCPQVAKIAFVAHQHDDNVAVCVVLQLFQPALSIFVRQVFGNVVHQESANCPTVVPEQSGIKAIRHTSLIYSILSISENLTCFKNTKNTNKNIYYLTDGESWLSVLTRSRAEIRVWRKIKVESRC